jgi:transcriptional regulator with XRE-family HTH domain
VAVVKLGHRDALRIVRKAAGLTQRQVARMARVSTATAWKYENDQLVGMRSRCKAALRSIYRQLARRHPKSILVPTRETWLEQQTKTFIHELGCPKLADEDDGRELYGLTFEELVDFGSIVATATLRQHGDIEPRP